MAMSTAKQLTELLELRSQPVAVSFLESAPQNLPRIEDVAPSGCTYWKFAAEGRSFYTEASDHFGCPIGAHTHGIDLPQQQGQELNDVIGTMTGLEYLDPSEVEGIPRREKPFGVATYSPLADELSSDPDVVLVCGTAKQMMLIAEAAQSAGVASPTTMVGRPTCAAIPEVMKSGLCATNLGCIGNRVYTEMEDGELYFAFAGDQLDAIVNKLAVIINANAELQAYHREKISASLSTIRA
jgi:uncharacterized protein (DUF169 family)